MLYIAECIRHEYKKNSQLHYWPLALIHSLIMQHQSRIPTNLEIPACLHFAMILTSHFSHTTPSLPSLLSHSVLLSWIIPSSCSSNMIHKVHSRRVVIRKSCFPSDRQRYWSRARRRLRPFPLNPMRMFVLFSNPNLGIL